MVNDTNGTHKNTEVFLKHLGNVCRKYFMSPLCAIHPVHRSRRRYFSDAEELPETFKRHMIPTAK